MGDGAIFKTNRSVLRVFSEIMSIKADDVAVLTYTTLRRSVQAPWQARMTVKLWLPEGHPVRADALQVVSELVANACEHVPYGPRREWLMLRLGFGDGFVRLEVIDPGTPDWRPTTIPHRISAPEAERGRGLGIVAGLSLRCGTHVTPRGHRVVWCDLALDAVKGASDHE